MLGCRDPGWPSAADPLSLGVLTETGIPYQWSSPATRVPYSTCYTGVQPCRSQPHPLSACTLHVPYSHLPAALLHAWCSHYSAPVSPQQYFLHHWAARGGFTPLPGSGFSLARFHQQSCCLRDHMLHRRGTRDTCVSSYYLPNATTTCWQQGSGDEPITAAATDAACCYYSATGAGCSPATVVH